jgi:hypothetical protein
MNDPFSDIDDDEQALITTSITSQIGGDKLKSLDEVKRSLEWPDLEHAVREELAQLQQKGTWKLVNQPEGAIPILNRWVFAKKYNKEGDLLKYKGRLVVKGYSQRPGHDYVETFAPVVQLEMLHAILAMAVTKDFQIHQMDMKGAYLNGTLKETIYMRQPQGYEDESGKVCLLIKTLYGLKQAGHEWNLKLDEKLCKHKFCRL